MEDKKALDIKKTFLVHNEGSAAQASPYRRDYAGALIRQKLSLLPNKDELIFEGRHVFRGEELETAAQIKNLVSDGADKTYLGYLSINMTNSRHRHAVALIIKPTERKITYIDPLGSKMEESFRNAISSYFHDFTITDYTLRQQHDATSCSVITVDNLLRAAEGRTPKLSPDVNALREEHNRILPQSLSGGGSFADKTFEVK